MSVYRFEKLPHEPTQSKEILSVYLQGLLDVDIHITAGGSINGSSSNSFLILIPCKNNFLQESGKFYFNP